MKKAIMKVMKDIFLKLMFSILKHLHELLNDSPVLPEGMKIEKVEKVVSNLHDKTEYVNLKHAINHGLVLKESHRLIKSNQNAWLKLYIDINTYKRKGKKSF